MNDNAELPESRSKSGKNSEGESSTEASSGPRGPEVGASSTAGQILVPVFPKWVGVVPFFMSAFLYLSGILSVFSPVPLIILYYYTNKKPLYFFAILTNLILVGLLAGLGSAGIFMILVVSFVLAFPVFARRKLTVNQLGSMLLIVLLASGWALMVGYGLAARVNPLIELRDFIFSFLDQLLQSLPAESRTALLADIEVVEWKQGILREFPSAVGIFAFFFVVINLGVVLRLNPRGIRFRLGLPPYYFRSWKAPDWLVWPTLVAGLGTLMDWGWGSTVALNGFRFFMAVYALQGVAILSFFSDVWGLRRWTRSLLMGVALFVLSPLVLSLGFFDLWFDFRSKIRQS